MKIWISFNHLLKFHFSNVQILNGLRCHKQLFSTWNVDQWNIPTSKLSINRSYYITIYFLHAVGLMYLAIYLGEYHITTQASFWKPILKLGIPLVNINTSAVLTVFETLKNIDFQGGNIKRGLAVLRVFPK